MVRIVSTKSQRVMSVTLSSKRLDNNNYDSSDSGGGIGLLVNENQEVEVLRE